MSKKHEHDHGETLHFEQISHHGVAFENRDLSGTGIFVFMVLLVVFTAVLALGVWGYYVFRAHQVEAEKAEPLSGVQTIENTPANTPDPTKRFPQPVIQPDDQGDMRSFKQQEDQALNSYGWVDKNAGYVHIPIDAAIKDIAQKGLPARPAQQMAPVAHFAAGDGTPTGNAGGTRPVSRQ